MPRNPGTMDRNGKVRERGVLRGHGETLEYQDPLDHDGWSKCMIFSVL